MQTTKTLPLRGFCLYLERRYTTTTSNLREMSWHSIYQIPSAMCAMVVRLNDIARRVRVEDKAIGDIIHLPIGEAAILSKLKITGASKARWLIRFSKRIPKSDWDFDQGRFGVFDPGTLR